MLGRMMLPPDLQHHSCPGKLMLIHRHSPEASLVTGQPEGAPFCNSDNEGRNIDMDFRTGETA